MAVLPRAVGLELLPFKVADVDVVEKRLDDQRDVDALAERDLGGLVGAREARVDAHVERNVRDLLPEAPRLLLAALGERNLTRGVAVHAALHVQHGLAVPDQDEEAHG